MSALPFAGSGAAWLESLGMANLSYKVRQSPHFIPMLLALASGIALIAGVANKLAVH
jgi:hypothetical protein